MTDTYQFPPMAKLDEWDAQEQLAKTCEELSEAIHAHDDYANDMIYHGFDSSGAEASRKAYLMELMDVIHCVETAMRMEYVDDDEYREIRQLVIEKNRKRGYYDD